MIVLINYLAVTPNIVLQLNENQYGGCRCSQCSCRTGTTGCPCAGKPWKRSDVLPGVQSRFLHEVSISFNKNIRKTEPPFVLPISIDKKRELEHAAL